MVIYYFFVQPHHSWTSNSTRGGADPSGLDADSWRRILVSIDRRTLVNKQLFFTIALQKWPLFSARSQSSVLQNDLPLLKPTHSVVFPLDKNPGIRPIGIGEVIRRIIRKSIISVIKPEILLNAEPFNYVQVCHRDVKQQPMPCVNFLKRRVQTLSFSLMRRMSSTL